MEDSNPNNLPKESDSGAGDNTSNQHGVFLEENENTDDNSADETVGNTISSQVSDETEPSGQPEQLTQQTISPVTPTKKSHKKLIIILIIATLLLLSSTCAAVYFLILKKDTPTKNTTQDISQTSVKVETEAIGTPVETPSTDQSFDFIEPVFLDINVLWQKPSPISLRGFYDNEVQYAETDKNQSLGTEYDPNAPPELQVQYYIAGTFSGGEIIYASLPYDGMGGGVEVFLVKGSEVTLLNRYSNSTAQPDTEEEKTYFTNKYAGNVAKDTKTIIKGTWAPEKIVINGQKMKVPTYEMPDGTQYSYPEGGYNPEKYVDPQSTETLVTTLSEGKVYEITRPKDGYKLSLFEMELPNYFRVSYTLDGEISSAKVQPIIWSDGSRNSYSFSNFGYGCGGGSYNLIADLTANDLVQIGKSDGGQPIYMFKDMNQKVAAQILSEVNARDDKWIEEGKDPKFTAEEFVNNKAVIIVQDGMDRWVVFKNSRNFISGGCAKPVVYLYPEAPTTLNVQVGADVTISEPFYEQNGWQNVTALPNGQLLYRGLSYESLFWEGYGFGSYPDKSSEGVVVPRDAVISTMRQQLAQQGFNQKESDDFIAFWTNNIPNKPYVRLTWLSTQDMNALAPLYLSVKPDTVIRTFIEMEGLDTPRTLKPQKFNAPLRRGFTVTEWGGLAISGLQNITYEN